MKAMSDDKIRAVRDRLALRGVELRARIARVKQDLGRVLTPLPRDSTDAAIVLENDEILQAVEESAFSELKRIEHALERLDTGTFAICEHCGKPVDDQRLAVVPYATECRACLKEP